MVDLTMARQPRQANDIALVGDKLHAAGSSHRQCQHLLRPVRRGVHAPLLRYPLPTVPHPPHPCCGR